MMPLPASGILHAGAGKSRARVLIVDDEPLVRWSLEAALRAAGFDPVTASGGAEAVALAGTGPRPAVALIDLELYGTDVLALAGRIRALAPGCRVLGLTTSGPDLARHTAWPAVTFIRKPYDLADVVRLVEREVA